MSRRGWTLSAITCIGLAVAVVALALFQPWKLWIDDEVQQAAPVGAAPITAPTSTTAEVAPPPAPPTPPTTGPTTAAPTVEERVVAPTTTTIPSPPTTTIPPPIATQPSTTVAPIPLGGQLVGLDHATTGTVVLLQDAAGVQVVRIENLDTSNGPDLFVYLSTNPADGPEGQFDDDVVNLGRLQGNVGSANYAIPAGTDLFRYASVVIWCDRFDSAFGAAPLT